MRIDLLKTTPDRAGRYFVQFGDGSTLRLYRQTVEDFGLYSGQELTDAQHQLLLQSAAEMSAKMRAVRIISATNISKKDLQRRLVQKGEQAQQADEAIAWLEDLHLLDDRKTAEQIVHSCISKGYGLSRARQALYEKRIPKELWDSALEDYPDQREYVLRFLKTKLSGDPDEREIKRAIDALIRRGHSYTIIRGALNALSLESEEFPEEE